MLKTRVAGILIEDEKICLVQQSVPVDPPRNWNIPGGEMNPGESVETALIREMKEETGLDVKIDQLLYVGEAMGFKSQHIHMLFKVVRTGGQIKHQWSRELDPHEITDITLADIKHLQDFGFPKKFTDRVMSDFPDAGTYVGDLSNIGL